MVQMWVSSQANPSKASLNQNKNETKTIESNGFSIGIIKKTKAIKVMKLFLKISFKNREFKEIQERQRIGFEILISYYPTDPLYFIKS